MRVGGGFHPLQRIRNSLTLACMPDFICSCVRVVSSLQQEMSRRVSLYILQQRQLGCSCTTLIINSDTRHCSLSALSLPTDSLICKIRRALLKF